MVIDNLSADFLEDNSWRIPSSLITREGKVVDTSGERWHLPLVTRDFASIDFEKIENKSLRLSLMFYVADRIQHTSSDSGYKVFWDVWRTVLINYHEASIAHEGTLTDLLVSIFEKAISVKKNNHKLHEMYEPIQWYIYCTETYPELGFYADYAFELDCMTIPGGPKGEAVRMLDPTSGPLNHSLEVPLLINALRDDCSDDYEHVRQRAALALSLAYGRNPANLTYLREEDFFDLTPDSNERCYILKMPRIKKRLLNPRDDFLEEYVDPFYAKFIIDLIEKNKSIEAIVLFENRVVQSPNPLFMKPEGNKVASLCGDLQNVYNCTSSDITGLMKAFMKRKKIISPVTGDLMYITSRRLRYTLATGLAAEGISKKELARILDHSDTQHVNVYFELRDRIVAHLDKAAAKKLSNYYSYFRGNLIADDKKAVNSSRDNKHVFYIDDENPTVVEDLGVCGKSGLCHLDPPFSCYICPKFEAYDFADHEYVLECLLISREKKINKYDDARLGVQIDDVIAAVGQVCKLCVSRSTNA